ncbi:MAG: hypothetical protein QG622_614 [Actinomycetota bacterium]|nr:hypothetical protein [Actinomycetota bacterium]
MTGPSDHTGPGSGGALPETAAIIAQVATAAAGAAEQASGLAGQLSDEAGTLLAALGGGPPAQLAQAKALAQVASEALTSAASALHDASNGLRSFAGRAT